MRSTTRARASRSSTANLALTAWNREFADLFDLPPAMLRHGVGLDEIVRFNAGRGAYGPGDSEDFVDRAGGGAPL